jgi:integrase/recombinase XerD
MSDRRDDFIKERRYLMNVSQHTVSWYRCALYKWLPYENPTDDDLKAMVVRMREAGLKATGCNSAIRAAPLAAYVRGGVQNLSSSSTN